MNDRTRELQADESGEVIGTRGEMEVSRIVREKQGIGRISHERVIKLCAGGCKCREMRLISIRMLHRMRITH